MAVSNRPLGWVTGDAWLMVSARFLRTFAQSLIAVFFGIYLIELGYSLVEMGLLVTIGSIGSTVFATLVVFIGDTFGRRRLLIGFTAMMGLAGLGYAFTEQYTLLAFVSFFVGSLATSGSGPRGPVQPLEQAALPDTTTAEHRTDLYALAGMGERAARLDRHVRRGHACRACYDVRHRRDHGLQAHVRRLRGHHAGLRRHVRPALARHRLRRKRRRMAEPPETRVAQDHLYLRRNLLGGRLRDTVRLLQPRGRVVQR